jgi:hypothetical protein
MHISLVYRPLSKLVSTAPFIALSFPAFAQQVTTADVESELMGIVFGLFAFPVFVAYLTRHLVTRKTRQLMSQKSTAQKDYQLKELLAEEIPAHADPEFVVLDCKTSLDPEGQFRDSEIKRVEKLFMRAYRYDLLIALAYFFQPWIAIPYAFISTMRVLGFKSNFRAHLPGVSGFIRPLLQVWWTIFDPKWRFIVSVIAITASLLDSLPNIFLVFNDPLWSVVLLAPVLHIFLIRRAMTIANMEPNLKILVLRVFGLDNTAGFTFEGLLNYWCHFGSFFTIADSSFLKSTRRQQNRIIPFLFLMYITLILLPEIYPSLKADPTRFFWTVFPVAVVLAFSYIYLSLKIVEKSFIENKEDLLRQLEKLDSNPRNFDFTFKNQALRCFGNTWKIAVAECVARADAVLMDLRGYSAKNKGCGYEVDFLLDAKSTDKIIFLIDSGALPEIQQLILEHWAYLRTSSPNLKLTNQTINIYESSKQNAFDIQGIFDNLLIAAHRGTDNVTGLDGSDK